MNQEILMKLEMLNNQARGFEEQIQLVERQINELKQFEESLDNVKDSEEKEILASLGKGVFMKSEIKDKKLYVDVGAGFLVRKTPQEAKKVVEDQSKRLGEMRIQLQSQTEAINTELQTLMEEFEKSQK